MTDLYMSWSSETFASIIVFCVSQMTANITVASHFNSSNCTDVISTFQIKCYWFTCRIRSKCNRFNTDEMCFVAGQNCTLSFTNDFLFWNRLRKDWTQSSEILVLIKVITQLPNSEKSYKGKVKTHNYINRQNQSTTGTNICFGRNLEGIVHSLPRNNSFLESI